MTGTEEIQMARYYNELEDDLRHTMNKYGRIMGWGVPELDESAAKRLILDAMHKALEKIEQE